MRPSEFVAQASLKLLLQALIEGRQVFAGPCPWWTLGPPVILRAMDTLELGLQGKVAIVTGGSEGMGRAAAERLARSGARVTVCARRKDVLERAAEDIRKATGGELLALPADVS